MTDTDYGIYYTPEHHGLELVGSASEDDMSYEFDIFAVWKDESGNLYWASDSGCSCPSPFESYVFGREPQGGYEYALTKSTVAEVHKALDEWTEEYDGSFNKSRTPSAAELHAKLAAL